ncbi:amidohydrolase family protein [Streptomyces antimycoticus]|uniref:amidohydrolase family protein n=1 Tax=Streptomyces antimycoticus TaxID=68175 RepID=UPI000A3B0284|nr:amidohydrolase family protein [Streptomyces antimycoticus]
MTSETTGRLFDVHTHATPTDLLTWLADRGLADTTEVDHGVVRLASEISGVPEGTPIPLHRAQYDVAHRLADMDRMGVSRQAVSLPPFVTCSGAEPELAREVVARGNDALAAFADRGAGRLLALGTVPLGITEGAEEARRCLDELGCAGVAIGSHGAGRDLDDPVHEPLWEFLAERDAFVFLHPNTVSGGARLGSYWLPQLVGYPAETALAVSRLIFGGVLERHELTVCLAHGGGCLPALAGRLDLGWHRKDVARTVPLPPSAYLRRLYVDSATFSPLLLARLVEDFGPDQVLLGTDYPFELADFEPAATLAALEVSPADRDRVASATARKLLGQ